MLRTTPSAKLIRSMTDAINGLKAQKTPFTFRGSSPYDVAMRNFAMEINTNTSPRNWDKSQTDNITKKAKELTQAIINTDDNIWAADVTHTSKQEAVNNLKRNIDRVIYLAEK